MNKFINKYILLRNIGFKYRLIIYFSLLTVIPIYIVAGVTYKNAERIIENNVTSLTSTKLQQVVTSLDIYIESADNVLQSIFFDETLSTDIYESGLGEYERVTAKQSAEKVLTGYLTPAKYIKQIYIVTFDEEVFASSYIFLEALKEESWFQEFFHGDKVFEIVPTHTSSAYSAKDFSKTASVITIIRKFIDIDENKTLGIIGLDIDYEYIKNIFEDTNEIEGVITLLFTDAGEHVYSSNMPEDALSLDDFGSYIDKEDGNFSMEIGGMDYFAVYTRSEITDWKVIQLIPYENLFTEISEIRIKILYVGLVCIVVSLLAAVGASLTISSPIKRLSEEMHKVEKGDLSVQVPVNSNDEIAELTRSFNLMVRELSTSINKIYEDENTKKQIELRMLQQQINPHFLYNTLDSINWMARIQNASNIASTINSLVKLLQASTYTNKDFVTIQEEIENVKNYIAIQKFRYSSLFDVNYEIDDSITEYYTLKLILQPIVENAIHHGLEDITEGGKITIGARKSGENIELWVEDNGKGIDEEQLKIILEKDIKETTSYSSIGISNTEKRIKLYYGESYGLAFDTTKDKGTKVIVTIPIRSEERRKLND